MNKAVENFLLLCRCLRPRLGKDEIADLRRALGEDGGRWSEIIQLANAHYLTPALWSALEDKGLVDCLPEDARDFLRDAHRLSGVRNTRVREQASELVGVLNDAGITPVMLKGGVYLFEGDRRAFTTRMMVDLDLLVPERQLERSVSVARDLGYEILTEAKHRTHQYHPLGRPGDPASVEFHRDVGKQRTLLPVNKAFRQAVPLNADGLRLLALSPTHRVLHNIFHAEIQDRAFILGRFPLRALHDLLLITGTHGEEIEWPEIRAAMARERLDNVLDSYLSLANRFLGLPLPPGFEPPLRAGIHHHWRLAQVRWKPLESMIDFLGTMTHPFGRARIEYIYGQTSNPVVLQLNRVRHGLVLIGMYRFRVFAKLVELYRKMYKSS